MKKRSSLIPLIGLVVISVLIYNSINQSYLELPRATTSTLKETVINEVALKENAGCYHCHGNMQDIRGTHAQAGCTACHAGNGTEESKESGHLGLIAVPGNFSNMEKTCGACHAESVHHITNSIMATNSGLISVDRYIFGVVEILQTF